MAHLHETYDGDPYFSIDKETRVISLESEVVPVIAKGDHNSEIFTFEMPRYVEGHDMSLCDKIQVHYINLASGSTSKKSGGVYDVVDAQISEDDDEFIVFSWTISQNATVHIGSLNFAIRFLCLNGSKIDYSWATTVYSGIPVSESIDNANLVVEQYADVLEAWYLELLVAGTSSLNMVSEAKEEILNELTAIGNEKMSEFNTTADEKIESLRKHTLEGLEDEVLAKINFNSKSGTGNGSIISNDLASNTASGEYANAENYNTSAAGKYSHAEGEGTYTTEAATGSHAEGTLSHAEGPYSHAEGNNTTASGTYSHAEGYTTQSIGTHSHSEGFRSIAAGDGSHAEGDSTEAVGLSSHSEGNMTRSEGEYSHAEGLSSRAVGDNSHAEGYETLADGENSHAEGHLTTSSGYASHAEGYDTQAINQYSHAEGNNTTASGTYSHAEGSNTIASKIGSHAEGAASEANGDYSHAEGNLSEASGLYAHSEGQNTTAQGDYSHAEGHGGIAAGKSSHAEGNLSDATGDYSHAEGQGTRASGIGSHSEGKSTRADGNYSHTEGVGTKTTAEGQTAMGNYNATDNSARVMIGNGTSDSNRSNSFAAYDDKLVANVPVHLKHDITYSDLTRNHNQIWLDDIDGGLYVIHGWYNGKDLDDTTVNGSGTIVKESMSFVFVPPLNEIMNSRIGGDIAMAIGRLESIGPEQNNSVILYAGAGEGNKIVIYVGAYNNGIGYATLNCAVKIGVVPTMPFINRPTQPLG